MHKLWRQIVALLDDDFQEPWVRYAVIGCALVLASWLIPKTVQYGLMLTRL
ncbi:MAG: hypothetical protein WAZ27_00030 [Minisyncoccia bacterium]